MKKNDLVKFAGVALVIAIIATGLFYGLFVSKLSSNAGNGNTLVVAARPLKAGTQLTATDVKTIPWPTAEVPKGNYSKVDDVTGSAVFDAIGEGEPIAASRLASGASAGGAGVPSGMRAVSVHVTDSTGVMALLRGGQKVDVQVVNGKVPNIAVRTVLEGLTVLSVNPQSEQTSQGASLPVVTLLANPSESDILAAADAGGRVRLALRNALDTETRARSPLTIDAVMKPSGSSPPVRQLPSRQLRPTRSNRPRCCSRLYWRFFWSSFLMATLTAAIAWLGFLKRQVEAREAQEGVVADDEIPESHLLREDRLSTLSFWDNLLARFDFVEILKTRLAQADLGWSVGRVTIAMLLLATLGFLVLKLFLPWFASFLGAAALAAIPYLYIMHLRKRRFDKFRDAVPDVLDSLGRAMRAGFPLSPAMETVIAETPPVVAAELRHASTEANLGLGWPGALEKLSARVPLLEVNLFVAAVQLHSRTGGKLSEVLSGLAENMRESGALRGEVRAVAAHGKLTGVILTLLPLAIAGMMMMVSPGYMTVLWNHPWGKDLIAAAVGCLVIARHFVIRRIVDVGDMSPAALLIAFFIFAVMAAVSAAGLRYVRASVHRACSARLRRFPSV